MNKRFTIFRVIAIALTLLCFVQISAFAVDKEINIVINGEMLKLEQPPIMHEGSVFVPLRGVVEHIGVTVFYEPNQIDCVTKTKTVTLIDTKTFFESETSAYYVYTDNAWKGGFEKIIKNGRTMIPARLIAESFGATVSWDSASATVTITADISENERLSEEEISVADAFTVDIAQKMLVDTPLYRYFARLGLERASPKYVHGNKSYNFVYKSYSAQGGKALNVSPEGEITLIESGVYDDYSEYPQYMLTQHAEYLPFQEKYDGYLGAVAYTNTLLTRIYLNFDREYFSYAPEGLPRENDFEIVKYHDSDEYLLLFPKYEGTIIEVIKIDSENNEQTIYRGNGPIRLYANISELTLHELAVIFTLGEDSLRFIPRTMTPWHYLSKEERVELKTENQSYVETKIEEGNYPIKNIPHNRIMNLTSGWSLYYAYEYF